MSAPRIKRLATSFSLVLGSIALTLLAVHAADRALGRWTRDPRLTAGLLFPPQVELAVKTYEYNYTIKTNNLGLRDEDYDPRKRPQVLIAAIGDSFTFGQGVNIQDTWVQRVERSLRAKGLDVEILNFGEPGSSPLQYARVAEEALPVVTPDLVLVGVLQSNDISQLDPDQARGDETYRRHRASGCPANSEGCQCETIYLCLLFRGHDTSQPLRYSRRVTGAPLIRRVARRSAPRRSRRARASGSRPRAAKRSGPAPGA